MTFPLRLLFCVPVVLALAGCGGSTSPLKAGGPHQGVMIQLPASKGYAELVTEPLANRKKTSAPAELVLYFLGTDMTTPLTQLPTDVTLEAFDPESRQKIPFKMAPSPKASDPAGAARFASGPIDRDFSNFAITGSLRFDLGGPSDVAF